LHNKKRPTKRSQDTDSVLSGKMMACQLDVVHWTLGILRHFGAFFWLRVFPALKQSPHPPQRQ